jgi:hypothetical protein
VRYFARFSGYHTIIKIIILGIALKVGLKGRSPRVSKGAKV